jgi:DNA-binding MarR family transcriptional regulator
MENDAIDLFVERLGRELPATAPGAVEVVGRIERLALLFEGSTRSDERAYGVAGGELDVLAALRMAGLPYELTPTTIAARVVVTSGGMTKRLDRLEAAGLVERRRNPSDRRGWLISLSERGLKVIDRILPASLATAERFLAGLDPAERETLGALLRKLLVSEPFASID